jgi:hypothetical protein
LGGALPSCRPALGEGEALRDERDDRIRLVLQLIVADAIEIEAVGLEHSLLAPVALERAPGRVIAVAVDLEDDPELAPGLPLLRSSSSSSCEMVMTLELRASSSAH